ncbi:MAG: type II secretion system protein GspG [Phycisphaerales bacterium]|nr:type II secretion system protein GspG [Phycisphaerales bacterium]
MSTPSLDIQIARRTTKRMARPGFSLIELTAVLVILGLLMAGAAIAVPKQIQKARVRVTKTSMTTIKTAINTYMADHAGVAPATVAELIPSYIEQGSEIDAWDRPYYYRATPGTANPFELISSGNDREFQTPDDIDLWKMNLKTGN